MKSRKLVFSIFGLGGALLSLLAPANPSRNLRNHASAKNDGLEIRQRVIPTSAAPVISATLGQHDPGYLIRRSGRAWLAKNARQQLSASFTREGVTIRTAGTQIRVGLSGYGYGEQLKSASAAMPQATANRVEYRRGDLTEWYVNGPMGLEQGFTLEEQPGKQTGEPLQFALSFSGDILAKVEQAGNAISLARRDGQPTLRYAGLMAWDAVGRELPAWMELGGDRVILAVRDAGARYPIVVDPMYSQSAILTDPSGAANEGLGGSFYTNDGAAVDDAGDTVLATSNTMVGPPPNFTVTGGNTFVFVKSTSGMWQFAAQLTGTVTSMTTGSTSVAISGDGKTAVVGNCGKAVCIGTAFVYEQPTGGWNSSATLSPTAALTPSSASSGVQAGARFGITTAIDRLGDTIAVGSPCEITALNPSSPICGEVHVYVKPATGWANTSMETAVLSEAFTLATNQSQCPGAKSWAAEVRTLGVSLSMDSAGDAIVTGAKDDFGCSSNTNGAAYVFVKPASGWVSTTLADATLTALNGASGDGLGISSGISGDGSTVVAGAWQPGNFGATRGKGTAYVYVKPAAGWSSKTQDAQLSASNGQADDSFGQSALASNTGSTIVVGAPRHPFTAPSTAGPGAVYVFLEPAGGWPTASNPKTEDQALTTANCTPTTPCMDINGNTVTPPSSNFGSSLSLSNDASTIVGASNTFASAQVGSNKNQGALFVYTLPPCSTPTISTPLVPATAAAGGAGFTLTVNGTNFATGAVVTFNGTMESTTVVSATQVTAMINAADVATPGMVNVTVTNPGGCVSAPATFNITVTPPAITPPVAPGCVTAGGAGFTLTVNGTNFVSGAVVTFNNKAETTTFVSATQLTAAIPAGDITTAGTVNVSVTNPGGASSSNVPFTISPPAPTISSFSPTHIAAGAAFTLTVNGTNFDPTSVVGFQGNNETTTFVNSTQLTASIPAIHVSKGGPATISVTTPGPCGSTATATVHLGLDDFSLGGGGGGVTVKRGDKATVMITVTPTANGFANPIMFSVSGLPAKTTGTFDMPTVTPGMNPVTVTLSVTTTKASGVPPAAPSGPPSFPRPVWLGLQAAALLSAWLARRSMRRGLVTRRLAACMSLAIVLLAAAAMMACAPSGGTPTGTSTLAIAATSGSDVQNFNVMLTVQ